MKTLQDTGMGEYKVEKLRQPEVLLVSDFILLLLPLYYLYYMYSIDISLLNNADQYTR